MEEKGLSVETADKIGTFVKERGHPLELLFKLKQEGSSFLENSASIDALNDLEILFKALEKSKCIGKVAFDLSLARGLDYYTGVVYEAVFKGGAQVKLFKCCCDFLCFHFACYYCFYNLSYVPSLILPSDICCRFRKFSIQMSGASNNEWRIVIASSH